MDTMHAPTARAIAETAFVVSKAPVLLSLEMHCSEKQQARLHELLHQHLGRRLVRASEVEVAAEAMLTLQALQGRVLVQAKLPSQGRASTAFQAALFTSACRASARASSASAAPRPLAQTCLKMGVESGLPSTEGRAPCFLSCWMFCTRTSISPEVRKSRLCSLAHWRSSGWSALYL